MSTDPEPGGEDGAEPQPTPPVRTGVQGAVARAAGSVEAHPLVATGVLTAVIGVAYAVWVWTHRHLGGFDPDEAGYIATALRYHRSLDFGRPFDLVHAVGATGSGPLVPLLSLPLLIAGPRDPRVVMMVQPVLLVVGSVSIAGTVLRMVGPGRARSWAAVGAGVGFATLPGVGLSVESFWLGLGAAACMAAAMWALLASDRLTNRWTWAFGAAVGAMLLSRTMVVAFVPGLAAAAVLLAGRRREAWIGLLRAGAVTVVVAGPWWVVEWPTISQYLLSYGIGPRASLFGSGDVIDRTWFRFERIATDSGQLVARAAAVAAILGLAVAWWRRRRGEPDPRARETAAVLVALGGGFAALLSTTNNGVWFELPLMAVFAAAAGALVTWLPRLLRASLAVLVLAQAAVVLPVLWWLVPPAYGVTAHYEWGFAQYDERFLPSRRSQQPAAAEQWWSTATAVAAEMRRLSPRDRPASFVVSGNMVLFNSNTLALACELDGWGPRIVIPDTTLGRRERALSLAPRVEVDGAGNLEQVLVLAVHDRILFTPDRDVALLRAEARTAGWREVDRWSLPTGGHVEILRHPDSMSESDEAALRRGTSSD